LFAPVWTLLYVAIAIAGWLSWRAASRVAVITWVIALVLNGVWSWLFFGQHWIGVALVDIAALWASILTFIITTRRDVPTAAALFLPYLAWVSFATALNLQIWRLNS